MKLRRLFLVTALLSIFGGCTTIDSAPSPEVRQAIARAGRLRVGINLGNPVLAKRGDTKDALNGIAVDLGRMIAARLDAEFAPVTYPNAAKLIDGARAGEWDIGFAAIDPARADVLLFTAPYMEVSVTYLVPDDSPIRSVSDADRPGVRVGVGARNAADLYLSRSLNHARLVRVDDNLAGAVELLKAGKADIFAGNRQGLLDVRDQLGGYRILDERFYAVEHAVAIPREKVAALAYLKSFVEEAKSSGSVAMAISRHSIRGVEVAPLASP